MEENMELTNEQVSARVLIALTKNKGGKKLLVSSMEGYGSGYTVDGIYVEKDGKARIFSLDEKSLRYGINSQDLNPGDAHYEEISENFGGFDGEESTEMLIQIYYLEPGDAAVEAKAFGWLPEAGEIGLAMDNIEAFNAACEAVGATPIANGKYWLSQRRNANYAWFYDAEQKGLGSWLGGMNTLIVRPVKSADEYEEVD